MGFFTQQERNLLLFLIIGLIIGAAVKIFKPIHKKPEIEKQAYWEFQNKLDAIGSVPDTTQKLADDQSLKPEKKRRDFRININTASADEMVNLPRVGPVLAKRIVDYREQHGYFDSVEELIRVKGIGKKRLEKLKPFVFVGSEK
ncbi:hypothetical protein B6D60_06745 [candidate division KSB1 bacterium 4484_87]|nr:MAG: hypothetical protein B6D60_06745 [candidate division KSB1 bacterium 4484_87]